MWESLKDYSIAVGRRWWAVGISGVMAIVGFIQGVSGGLDVPVWIWVLLAFSSLSVAQFLAFHEIRTKLSEKTKKSEVRATLARFLSEGQQVALRCSSESDPPPEKEAVHWAARVETFLAEHLGGDYVASFRSSAGLPPGFTTISSMEHRDIDSYIRIRLARLQQFLAELRR
jgi:hypothetical protein